MPTVIRASSTQFARPGDTTAYADGDLIANSSEFAADNPIIFGLLEAKAAYAPGNAETFDVTIYARPLLGTGL